MTMLGRVNTGALQPNDNPKTCTLSAFIMSWLTIFTFLLFVYGFGIETNNFGGAFSQLTTYSLRLPCHYLRGQQQRDRVFLDSLS